MIKWIFFFLVIVSTSVYAFQFDQNKELIPDSSVIALYHLNEGVQGDGHVITDSSSNGLNGITKVAVDCTKQGKFGKGCYFPYTGDYNQTYIKVNDLGNSQLDLVDKFSISAWIFPYGSTWKTQVITYKYNSYGFVLDRDLKLLGEFCVSSTGYCNNIVTSSSALSTNEWHHVVFTFDGSVMKIYDNSNLVGSNNRQGTLVQNNNEFQIGLSWYNWTFNGVIDEVGVFNKALSAGEISVLYESEPTVPIPPSCTENWQCSSWNSCANGRQTRTCNDLNNCGTNLNKPILEQSCVIQPCVENWQCISWSNCINGRQIRACSDLNNCRTTNNKPVVNQPCTTPITCTENWRCVEWSSCVNGKQIRECIDMNNCGTSNNLPEIQMGCTIPICTENWQCSSWNSCANGRQTRTCNDLNNCRTNLNKPILEQSCEIKQDCTESWECTGYGGCVDKIQRRICVDRNSCGTTSNNPTLEKECEEVIFTIPEEVALPEESIEECIFNDVYWADSNGNKINEVSDGNVVFLTVETSGCDGKTVDFIIFETDGIFGLHEEGKDFGIIENGVGKKQFTVKYNEDKVLGFFNGGNPDLVFTAITNPTGTSNVLEVTSSTITAEGAAPATCSNGIQDVDEQGVDCGNSCDYECPLSHIIGIDVFIEGTPGQDYAVEWSYHDRKVDDTKIIYIKDNVNIGLKHNQFNRKQTSIEGEYGVVIGVNGQNGIADDVANCLSNFPNNLGQCDAGLIKYKIDRDEQGMQYARVDMPDANDYNGRVPYYTSQFSLSGLNYQPDSIASVVGTTGNNGQPHYNDIGYAGTISKYNLPNVWPVQAGRRVNYGVVDSFGDEWHTLTYWDDDSAWNTGFAVGASDGGLVQFVVNPKTPLINFKTLTAIAQYYTTPAKTYFVPYIFEQTTYVTDDIEIYLINIMNSNPISYKINNGAVQTYSTPINSNSLNNGVNTIEYWYDDNYHKTRKIIKNPSYPSDSETHPKNLLWDSPEMLNIIKQRIARAPYQSLYSGLDVGGSSDIFNGFRFKTYQTERIIRSAFKSYIENNLDSRAVNAKNMLLDAPWMHESIGLELAYGVDSHTPNRWQLFYYQSNANELIDGIIGYDLLINEFRTTKGYPNGFTSIEDLRIRDSFAKAGKDTLQFIMDGIPQYHAAYDPQGDTGGHYAVSAEAAVAIVAAVMPSYNSIYYGTSGYEGQPATHLWAPYPNYPETWWRAATEATPNALLHPNPDRTIYSHLVGPFMLAWDSARTPRLDFYTTYYGTNMERIIPIFSNIMNNLNAPTDLTQFDWKIGDYIFCKTNNKCYWAERGFWIYDPLLESRSIWTVNKHYDFAKAQYDMMGGDAFFKPSPPLFLSSPFTIAFYDDYLPLCYNGQKDGYETGIDCGGSCPNVCGAVTQCDYEIFSEESINKWNDVVNPGETICIHAGTYTETLTPTKSGDAVSGVITYKAYPGDECKGDSSAKVRQSKTDCRVVIDGQNTRQSGIITNPQSFIRIEGFEIKNHEGHSIDISNWGQQGVQGIEIVNNYIHDANKIGMNSIHIEGGVKDSLVENNELKSVYRGVRFGGVSAGNPLGDNLIVRGNNIHKISCDGVGHGLGTNYVIENNWIHQMAPVLDSCHRDATDLYFPQANVNLNLVIRNNLMYDFTQLIYISPCCDKAEMDNYQHSNIDIYGNVLYNNEYFVQGGGETYGVLIDIGYTYSGNPSNNRLSDVDVHSNTCGWTGSQNPYGCIWLTADADSFFDRVSIRNNVMHTPGIYASSFITNYNSDYNLFYTTNSNTHISDRVEGSNSLLLVDPKFVSYTGQSSTTFDFHLQSDSLAIDKGDLGTIMPPSPFLDIDGTSRPQGSAFDIGAYEYVSGAGCTQDSQCPADDTCNDRYCEISTGQCKVTFTTNLCDDNNLCTTGVVCSNGLCGGSAISCSGQNPDGYACTTTSCNSADGQCSISTLSNNYCTMNVPNTNTCNPVPANSPSGCELTACQTSSSSWINNGFTAQTGSFVVEMDVTPNANNIDAMIGLSNGAATAYGSLAAIVRFWTDGTIDVRNGGIYGKDATMNYVAGTNYKIRMEVDVVNKVYAVKITPQGGTQTTIATNYAFRTEQSSVSQLNNWAMDDINGAETVCNFVLNPVQQCGNNILDSGEECDDGNTISGDGCSSSCTIEVQCQLISASWSASSAVEGTLVNLNVVGSNCIGQNIEYTIYEDDTLIDDLVASFVSTSLNPTWITQYVADGVGDPEYYFIATLVNNPPVNVQSTELLTVTQIPVAQCNDGIDNDNDGSIDLADFGCSDLNDNNEINDGITECSNGIDDDVDGFVDQTDVDCMNKDDDSEASTQVVGCTKFVDKNSIGGTCSDSNSGTTESSPWCTLNKAGQSAVAGDVVCVRAGTYTETLTPTKSGTAGNLITYKSYPGDECKGVLGGEKSGCGVIVTSSNAGANLNTNYIRVEGMKFIGTSSVAGKAGIESIGTTGVQVENNEITGYTFNALFFHPAQQVLIRNNYVHGTAEDGFHGGGITNSVFEYNVLGTPNYAMAAAIGSHADGMDFYGGNVNGLIIRYNTIYDYTQLVYFPNSGGATFSNIDIYGNVFYKANYIGGAPGIFFDLRFGSGSSRNINIHSNTFGFLQEKAFIAYLSSGSTLDNVKIYNNIFSYLRTDGSTTAMDWDPSVTNVVSNYNLFFGVAPRVGQDSNSIIVDPQFVNYIGSGSTGFDFRLQSTSPAIDKGDPNLATIFNLPSPFLDIDGTSRPQENAFDIGAYEYVSGAGCTQDSQCPADDTCNDRYCEVSTGQCRINFLNGNSCNDNNLCTNTDICSNGQCAGTAIDCSSQNPDGYACTLTSCNSADGSCSINTPSNSYCFTNVPNTNTCNPISVNAPSGCELTACQTSSSSWTNNGFITQTGSFVVEMDATPNANNIDAMIGLSNGAATAYGSLAAIVRFWTDGTIDVRNGGIYGKDATMNYVAGTNYKIRMEVDVVNKVYAVKITPQGGTQTTIATNYAFRTEQSSVSQLNNWAMDDINGAETVCNFVLNPVQCLLDADTNCSGCINLTEILAYIELFYDNTVLISDVTSQIISYQNSLPCGS